MSNKEALAGIDKLATELVGGFSDDQRTFAMLVLLLWQAKEALEPYVDVLDGDDGPVPNDAMAAVTEIERVLGVGEHHGGK